MEKTLCAAIERMAGRKIRTSQDFEWLAKEIEARNHEVVGVNTLKRMWGYYGGEPVNTRQSTLNVLAKFAGFADYDTFKISENPSIKGKSSKFVVSRQLNTRQLEPGMRIHVRWLPDRHLVMEHDGGGRFHVVEVENSKLNMSDTFDCPLIIEGEALFLGNLNHYAADGTLVGTYSYVAGKEGGVTFEVEESV